MTPTTHDDELADLRRDMQELASRWEVRAAGPRPDVATPSPAWRRRGRLAAWLPRVAVAAATIAALVALAFALLPRNAPPPPDVVEGPTPSTSDGALPAPGSFVEQLDRIPAAVVQDGPLLVTMDDLERAAAVAGVDPTGDQAEWLMGVQATADATGPFVLTSLHQDVVRWLGRWQAVEEEVGWTLSDADVVTSARGVGTQLGVGIPVGEPLGRGWLMVVDGTAASVQMAGAVPDGGVHRLGPDGGGQCLAGNSTAARLRGCPLWIADGDATRTVSTNRAVTEAATDEDSTTLAAHEELAAVVAALQEAGTGMPSSMTLLTPGEAGTHMSGQSLPSPWRAGGVALHVADDGTRQLWAAYEHPTEEDAGRNAAAMVDAWTDVESLRGWDIETVAAIQHGSTVVVEVTPVTTEAIIQVLTTLEAGTGPFRLADR